MATPQRTAKSIPVPFCFSSAFVPREMSKSAVGAETISVAEEVDITKVIDAAGEGGGVFFLAGAFGGATEGTGGVVVSISSVVVETGIISTGAEATKLPFWTVDSSNVPPPIIFEPDTCTEEVPAASAEADMVKMRKRSVVHFGIPTVKEGFPQVGVFTARTPIAASIPLQETFSKTREPETTQTFSDPGST